MSNLILCNGITADEPYNFSLTGDNVYTIEELCYYIYNNIYSITTSGFTKELVLWIRNNLHMEELAGKLEKLIEDGNNLKDIAVTIMCACDYYNEAQINYMIEVIDDIEGMSPILRRKIKADNYLKYKYYSNASKEYESILDSKEATELTGEQFGAIFHNIGIAKLHTSSFALAGESFKEAYLRNNNIESLKAYLFTLKMDGKEEEYEYELMNYSVSGEDAKKIANEYLLMNEEAKMCEEFTKVIKLEKMMYDGKHTQFNEGVDEYIEELKMDYIKRRAMER
ncbi:MAG: hypothetical protein IJD02_04730 [Lachnospiraceae bacterium]|nr:hypothetical protein [Lachnospiraceae bacterium]